MKFTKLKYRYTYILEIIEVDDGFLILENWNNTPVGKSNLYKINKDFSPAWEAKPLQKEIITNIYLDGPIVKVSLGSGEATLNVSTGDLSALTFSR